MKAYLYALLALPLATGALASPCGDKLKQLQSRYDAAPIISGSGPVGTPATGAETAEARLHHQPAAANPADANAAPLSQASIRDARFRNAMAEAQAADDSGDAKTCETSMRQAEQALNR